MKIEKINDNQIRCTLGKKDLADRNLKVSELAYGSEKAKELFRDMMKQASFEFGFEAEDIPLMIEAIPINADCIVLIVTKVDEPEELDTRFSRFSSEYNDDFDSPDDDYNDIFSDIEQIDDIDISPSATEINELFNKVKDYINNSLDDESGFIPFKDSLNDIPSVDLTEKKASGNRGSILKDIDEPKIIRIFSFDSFDEFSRAAEAVSDIYTDKSSLYMDDSTKKFYLFINKISTTIPNFNKVCNILSEFGNKERLTDNRLCYFDEHYRCIIKDHAIQYATKYAQC